MRKPCAFYTGLTPELSRGAHVASGGVALAYTASAATKQRRLERIVRLHWMCPRAWNQPMRGAMRPEPSGLLQLCPKACVERDLA